VTLSTLNRWENGRVLPSRLAWRELKALAAKRGCPLYILRPPAATTISPLMKSDSGRQKR